MTQRSLTVVGVGTRAGADTSAQTSAVIKLADKVLYLVGDPLSAAWIEQANPTAEPLEGLYIHGARRQDIYAALIDTILSWVRRSQRLCLALYGHPGVFVCIAHEAIRRARVEGVDARMLPAISAADWLFADLGLDPGEFGCQSYEATAFVTYRHRFDPHAALLLWQIGGLGDPTWPPVPQPRYVRRLLDLLSPHYPASHEVVIYEAAWDPVGRPSILRLPLPQLVDAPTSTASTLYVPPREYTEAELEELDEFDDLDEWNGADQEPSRPSD